AEVLEGLCRNFSVHAAGVVISRQPLANILPLTRDKDGEILTQFGKDEVEELGLLKADFLGLRTLTVMREAVELIRKTKGETVEVDALPMDDDDAFALLRRGDSVGVFQLESPGMRDLLRRFSMDRIEDLIAMVALYRPGPMDWIDDYVARKTTGSRVHYDHPLLEPILKETYGIMLYQEQVQQSARVLAGYSLGEGDVLRRAMGKKQADVMEKEREKFVKGCKKTNGIPADKAEEIFNNIAKFAGYGFNKSHASGYAIIAYQTAYLKAHYPEEFMAALISSEIGNTDKLPVFLNEARSMGLDILPPDVNASRIRFQPLENAIRYGLAGIKNVGEGAAEEIVKEREAHGPYAGFGDFCARVNLKAVNRKVLETLIRCGAFDSCGPHRAQLFGNIDVVLARAAAEKRDRETGQGNLFAAMEPADAKAGADEDLPRIKPWHENEQLAAERELLGIYMSGHPLVQHEKLLQRYCLHTLSDLGALTEKTETRIGGIVASVHIKETKKERKGANGQVERVEPRKFAIARIEDMEGAIEAVLFPDAYEEYGGRLLEGTPVLLCGDVPVGEETLKMYVREVYPLEQAPEFFSERVSIHLTAAGLTDTLLDQVTAILQRHPGRIPVFFCLKFPGGEEVFLDSDRAFHVVPRDALIHEIEQLLGENSLYVAPIKKACRKNPERRYNGNYRRN
ncbi:MAG: DNA polymerase III subunit alpha, partial [Lentisphaerae bacterium]|nr:DNA polymerase III subunit alpha [Lentisphaerota bacterium]